MNARRSQYRLCSLQGCTDLAICKELCPRHYNQSLRRRRLTVLSAAEKRKTIGHLTNHRSVARNGCWEWTGYINPRTGYGQTAIKGKTLRISQASALVFMGHSLDSGLQVLHHCDNRRCFNPEHLYLGTVSQNMKDAWRRGRRERLPFPYTPAYWERSFRTLALSLGKSESEATTDAKSLAKAQFQVVEEIWNERTPSDR